MNPTDLETRIRTASAVGAHQPPATKPAAASGPDFGQILSDQLRSDHLGSDRLGKPADSLAVSAARAGIKFSGHAQTRLASRQITLTGDDVARLGNAMTQAAAKGAKDSLVLMDKTAFVVSVANRTVITAVAQDALKDNIFTNIDSAMIL